MLDHKREFLDTVPLIVRLSCERHLQVSVVATDGGSPGRKSEPTVVKVTVVRNEYGPAWEAGNTKEMTVKEDRDRNNKIVTIQARDQDREVGGEIIPCPHRQAPLYPLTRRVYGLVP